LGTSADLGGTVSLPLSTFQQTATHIVGSSGAGKSYFLRGLIDQFIDRNQPVAVIDPHSELVQYAAWRLRKRGVPPSRTTLIDPLDPNLSLGFDPFRCGVGATASERASHVLDVFQKAWGQSSMDSTPRLEGLLRGTLHLLLESDLTLLDGYDLLAVENGPLRKALRERVRDEVVRKDWEEYERLSKSDKLAVTESTRNRFRRLISAPPIQRMLAQTGQTLNFCEVMDGPQFLLVDLGGLAPEVSRLLGGLIVGGLYRAARFRDPRRRRPYFMICDEAHEFMTQDIVNTLDQARKWGLHPILAHQRLRQLEREGPDMLSSILTNARIKIVFGGLERRDAEIMAKELFTGEVNGSRVKHQIEQTKFRPIADTFEVETESESRSTGTSRGWAESRSWMTGKSASISESHSEVPLDSEYVPEEHLFHHSLSHSESSSESGGWSDASGSSESESSGWSRSVVPITTHEEFREVSSIAYHSVADEWERQTARVFCLAKREALIKVFNAPPVQMRTRDVTPEKIDDRAARYRVRVLEASPCVQTAEAVQRQIDERRERLKSMVTQSEEQGRPFDVRSFRE
jgi:hypothetical protein